ncbi:MAG: hypothetical protein JWM66_1722 [Solirubrobacterales bacterium]|jgi:hypothetical protein|nr:hypothetical protein [Solirubrobacterales bacterium]
MQVGFHLRSNSSRRRDAAGASGTPRVCAVLLAAAVALCCSLLWSASASALIHRGHVFGSTLEGAGEHAFKAAGVAVNESTGEVYVADAAHGRVDAFKPNGAGGYEFVIALAVPAPQAVAVDNDPSSPSHGDIYVAGVKEKAEELELEPERNFIYKFAPSGEKIFKKQIFKVKEKVINFLGEEENAEFEVELESIYGLSVDASGKLWTYWNEEGDVAGFTSDEKNKLIGTTIKEAVAKEAFECRALPGFAVAPAHEAFYLRHERGQGNEECPEEEAKPPAVAHALVGKTDGAGHGLAAGLDPQNSTGVAVDETNGDAYVDNVTSIAAFTADGTPIDRFGAGSLAHGGALAVDHATEQVFAVDGSNGEKLDIFVPEPAGAPPQVDSLLAQDLSPTSAALIARIDDHGTATAYTFTYGTAACLSEPSACKTISGELPAAFGDQVTEVTLTGLEPDTPYYYRVVAHNEHGTAESARLASTFFTTLPSPQGLLPNHREWEMVSPPVKGGPLQAQSREGASIQASQNGDSITYGAENSGPTEGSQGNRSIAVNQFFSTRGGEGWSTQTITTPHNKGEGVITGEGETAEYRLFSPDLSLGLVEPELHQEIASLCEAPPLSAPLAGETCEGAAGREKTIYARANAPVQPGAAEKPVYEAAAANSGYLTPGYLPLVTGASNTGEVEGAKTKYGASLEFADATPDLNHVVFGSKVPLVKESSGEGLYQWDFGSAAPTLVSVMPESAKAGEPKLGTLGNTRHAISSNGKLAVFSSGYKPEGEVVNALAYLFLRDSSVNPAKTIQINAVQGEHVSEPDEAQLENEEVDQARFQTASADGSRIFFTDTWPLTDESTLIPTEAKHPADLYEYNVVTGKLHDLTASEHVGVPADVLGIIPGASEDGSYVYFVANGVLAPGAAPGACPSRVINPLELKELPPGTTCNLYVSRPSEANPGERETRFVAALSPEDAADWGLPDNELVKGGEANLTYVTSRVSPGSGEYLAFMSDRSLTGYDNTDVTSKAADEEVFLYSAKQGRIVCASCNPGGAPPKGVFDAEKSGEGIGLLVDRPQAWKNRWLAGSIPGGTSLSLFRSDYESRILSESGRLFFNSADALVSQDANAKEDVYQFEPQGAECKEAKGCVALISSGAATDTRESAFLDASVSGNDVFFLTSEKLLAQDHDGAFDVYDARVCGTGETGACLPRVQPPPAQCVGEACKPPISPQSSFSGSATANFSGPGNQPAVAVLPSKVKMPAKPLTRAQKLSKALGACRKHFKHAKKKRVSCEKQARKKYGSKKKSKAKKSDTIRRRTIR